MDPNDTIRTNRAGLKAAEARDATPTRITGPKGHRRFRWVVELEVAECWVEDGYNPDDDDVLAMLAKRLGYANIGHELAARVLRRPDQKVVRQVQGYEK